MNLQKLAEEINECFGESFLPKGFVRARATPYGTLLLNIGDRDGDFDQEGKCIGSGFNVGEAEEWNISKVVKNH